MIPIDHRLRSRGDKHRAKRETFVPVLHRQQQYRQLRRFPRPNDDIPNPTSDQEPSKRMPFAQVTKTLRRGCFLRIDRAPCTGVDENPGRRSS